MIPAAARRPITPLWRGFFAHAPRLPALPHAAAWLLLLLAPNFVYCWVAANPVDAFVRTVPTSIAMLAGLLAWTRRPRWVLWLMSPFYFLLPFELYYIVQYGHPSSPHILAVITESSSAEAMEYLGWPRLLALGSTAVLLGSLTFWVARTAQPLQRTRYVTLIAWASLVPLAQYAWLEWDWSQSRQIFDAHAATTSLEALMTTELATPMGATLSDAYPLGVMFRVRDYVGERQRLRKAAAQIRLYDFHAIRDTVPTAREVYVLVIGESSHPAHWAINGYPRETNPELRSLDGLVSFGNAVSPFPATRLAVPVILTGTQDRTTHRAPLGQASIISLFKQAGFQTYWLSNQAPLGLHDSIIAVHAYEADRVLYTNGGDHTEQGNFDDGLIAPFQRFLHEPGQRKFFVMHLMGSHLAYAKRYPPDFDYFKPSLQQQPDSNDPAMAVNTYDNTIRFTDHVLATLIHEIAAVPKTHAALLYLSDHGQNLPSATCQDFGHGRGNESDYRISALLWLSQTYRSTFPDVFPRAVARKDSPLYAPGAFHALAELARIKHPAENARLSWVSPKYRPSPRWTLVVDDFDQAKKVPPCGKLKMP